MPERFGSEITYSDRSATRPARIGDSRFLAWFPSSTGQRLVAILWGLGPVGYPLAANITQLLRLSDDTVTAAYRGLTVILSLTVIVWVFGGRSRATAGVYGWAYATFWAILLLRITYDLFGRDVYTQWPIEKIYQFAIGICLVPSLAYFVRPDVRALRMASVIAWISVFLNPILSLHAGLRGGRIQGRMRLDRLDPISLGKSGVLSCALAASSFFDTRYKAVRLASLVLFAIGMLVMLGGASRGPMVAWSAVMIAVVLSGWRARRRRRWMRLAFVAFAIPTISLGLSYIQGAGYNPVSRAASALSSEDINRIGRTAQLQTALEMFYERPFLGHTFVTPFGGHTHNLFVEALMGTGIVGTSVFVGLILASVRSSLRVLSPQHPSRWVALWFIVELVSSMFSGSLYINSGFWWSAVAVTTLERGSRSSDLPVH